MAGWDAYAQLANQVLVGLENVSAVVYGNDGTPWGNNGGAHVNDLITNASSIVKVDGGSGKGNNGNGLVGSSKFIRIGDVLGIDGNPAKTGNYKSGEKALVVIKSKQATAAVIADGPPQQVQAGCIAIFSALAAQNF